MQSNIQSIIDKFSFIKEIEICFIMDSSGMIVDSIFSTKNEWDVPTVSMFVLRELNNFVSVDFSLGTISEKIIRFKNGDYILIKEISMTKLFFVILSPSKQSIEKAIQQIQSEQ